MIFQARFLRSTSNLIRRRHPIHLFILFGFLLLTAALGAQTTWDGSSSTDWNTAANWSAGVPDANDVVTIANVANDPVIQAGTAALAKSVTISSGAVLTINASGSLTCNGSSNQHLVNNGTLHNNGTLTLGNLQGSGSYGFNNTGTFNNNADATFNLSNVAQYTRGIWNTSTGTVTNNGKMILGEFGDVGTDAIWNDGAFNNASCSALINIIANGDILGGGGGATFTNSGVIIENSSWNSDITTNSGIVQNLGFGSFTVSGSNTGLVTIESGIIWTGCTSTNWNLGSNWSKGLVPVTGESVLIPDRPNDPVVTTGTNAACGFVLLLANAQLTISANASLSVDGSGNDEGFRSYGTVTNNGTLNIGPVSNGGSQGLVNQGVFHNNSNAQVNINRTAFAGLYNYQGTFNNYGQITIGALATAGQYAFYNQGAFTNYVTGIIKVDNTTLEGFRNTLSTTFNNNGQIIIGSVSSVGNFGLQNWGVFNNNATGEITIDRSAQYGLYNSTAATNGTINNSGKITIGATASAGVAGVYNKETTTFNNNSCGQLIFYYPLRNYGSFTNTGLIRSITTALHDNPNLGLTSDGIIEYPLGNQIPNVTNNDIIVKSFSTACSGSPALSVGGANSFSVATTWYSNLALTVPAGTYNLATNTFTWNTTPSSGNYTLYFSINDPVNGCARTVSAAVTVVSPVAANAGPGQNICSSVGSATMAGNTPNIGTGTWTKISGPTGGTITSPNSPTTTITSLSSEGTYVFQWTIVNAGCPTNSSQVSIIVKAPPTTANAGPNASPCSLTTNLAGNAPTVGTGTWTLFNGPGTANFVNANSATTSVTVSVAGAYTFRWTIANAPCTASTDDVLVTFTTSVTPANAGPDQNICSTNGSATMAGNTPTVGSGTWSQVSGPVTAVILNPYTPNTSITDMTTAGTYVFKWTIANPPCTASEDQMSVVVKAPPTAANAGPNANPCGLTTNLAGNAPTVGTGTWTLFNGPGTANFANANSATTSVTVSVAGAYTFRWTIANAPCTASTDDVLVTFTTAVTPANAGPDQTICLTGGSATMAGNTPTVGMGTWTQVGGPMTATITTPGSPTTTITGMTTAGTYVFKWTITNPPCTASEDQMNVVVNAPPNQALAGPDMDICGLSVNMNGNQPSPGTGTWTKVSGPGQFSFSNANAPHSNVLVSLPGTYVFRWTITNAPCSSSSNEVEIVFTAEPATANAGPDQTICTTVGSTNMAGNEPDDDEGTGTWSQVGGPVTANISSPNSRNTGITGLTTAGTYVFKWSIANPPCSASEDQMNVVVKAPPTVANAGPNASPCGLTTSLAGNVPTVGTGTWTLFNGPGTANFANANSATTSVTVSVAGAYTFRWTIANAPCTASTDDVLVTFTAGPTTANAGGDQNICSTSGSATMAGNTPTLGTGTWTQVGGPVTATITTPGSPTTTITGMTTAGTYMFKWTITNPPCAASEDQMNVVVNAPPTAANAGPNASPCGLTTNLAGNAPTVGTGTWTLFNGPGTANFANANSPTTSVTVSVAGAYTFRWTIANAPCTASTDDVLVTFTAGAPAAAAGPDQTNSATCGLTQVTLAANSPGPGAGQWSVVIGTGGSFGNTSSPTSTFSGTAGMAYTLRWTISNPPCATTTDDILVTFNQNPTVNCPSDITVCPNAAPFALSGATPVGGAYTGPGVSNGIFNPASAGTGAHSIQYTYTTAAGCTGSCTFTITVQDITPPMIVCPGNTTVAAGPACTTNLANYMGAANASDNCGTPVKTQSPAANTSLNLGAHVLTLTATDQVNLTKTCSFTVTVSDQTAPSANCQNVSVELQANEQATITTDDIDDVSSDNCGIQSLGLNRTTFDCADIGAVTVTLTATDVNGLIGTCTATVTVTDPNSYCCATPAALCRAATVVLDATGQAGITVAAVNNSSTHECGLQNMSVSPAAVNCANVGAVTVTLTVTDVNNASSQCTAVVTVQDNTLPTITCPSATTVTCSANVPAVNLTAVTANDNCGAPAKVHVGDATSNQTCTNRKTVTRTYRATDASGNSKTCSQVITVYDDVKPNFTSVPANVTVQCNNLPAVGTATATDGCGGSVSIEYNGQTTTNGNCPDTYTLTRQWTATDACGNTKTATQRISVVDNQKPVFTNTPANLTVQCNAVPAPANPTATDNCDASVAVTYNGQTTTSGACPNAYTLTRTWTAADNCGNTKTVTQRISVVDTGKPAFTSFPENISIACDENPPAAGTPTASDACGSATVTYLGQSTTSGNCPGNFQIKRMWRATDACGNSTVATQTIQVTDNGVPVFTSVPGPITIECGTPLPPLTSPTASDVCGYAFVTFLGNVPSGSGCAQDYTVTRTWEAEDLCGNTATASQVITVLGNSYNGEGAENRDEGTTERITHRSSLIALYPNPTTDRVWLDLSDFAGEPVTVSIFGDLGQLVWEKHLKMVDEQLISMSLREAGAMAGMYTVRVQSGNTVIAKRLVLVE